MSLSARSFQWNKELSAMMGTFKKMKLRSVYMLPSTCLMNVNSLKLMFSCDFYAADIADNDFNVFFGITILKHQKGTDGNTSFFSIIIYIVYTEIL